MTKKNKSAAWKFFVSEKTQDFRLIDPGGEFFPGGSYLPDFSDKFLEVKIKYCKKFFLEKERNSWEHLILRGYLISGIHPGREKKKYFLTIPVNGMEIALRIRRGSMIQDDSISKTKNKEDYNDICSTCNHAELCVRKKNRQRPVWFCEEFDDHVPAKKQEVHEEGFLPAQSRVHPGTRENDSSQFKGLCINCKNRFTCSASRTQGGIWHCEEYK